jgi:multidrug efflux system membrane fusion protein
VQLYLTIRHDGITVPATVVQRGTQGAYAYVIKRDSTVEVRPITVVQVRDGTALIDTGLTAGERVVVDGQYRLRAGIRVDPHTAGSPANVAAARN